MKVQRRSFLQRLALAGATLASASAPYGVAQLLSPDAEAAPQTHLRPPGSLQDEDAFIAACIGCGLCGEICPVKAIRFYDRSGGAKVNTPYINPEIKACTLTGHCMKVCPTDAMVETPIREVKMGFAQIDRTACYPWVDRGVCGVCATACPLGSEAIGFDFANFYRPVIKEGCVGCGVCVEVCPHPSLPIKIVPRSLGDSKKRNTFVHSLKGVPERPSECSTSPMSAPTSNATEPAVGISETKGLLPF
jgi:MauM/NapG family ferredoxin protein